MSKDTAKPQDKSEKKYWLDNPRNVDKVYWSVWIICALLALTDFFYDKHTTLGIEEIPGFYGWYGFVACVGLVLIAKEIRKLVIRGEDYYD